MSGESHEKRAFLPVLLTVLILFASLSLQPNTEGEGHGDYPPPTQGDWIVNNETRVANETIFMEGLLNVTDGASLTMENVKLIFNSSTTYNPRIYVEWGAELFIINSNITSTRTLYTFEANGNLVIEGSSLSHIDGGIRLNMGNYTISNSTLFNNPQYAVLCFGGEGLYYNSSLSKVVLINNTFHSNYCGLLVSFFENPYLLNNTFINNEWGIISQVFGSPYMVSNNISGNSKGGIVGELGYIALYNNTISSNGGYGVRGDHTTIFAYNNSIYGNELWGIYAFNAPIFHDNNTFSGEGYSESRGGALQEWEILVNVKDTENNTLRNVNLTVYDRLGTRVWTGETIGSVRTIVLREYEISSHGTEIIHTPFSINATKGGFYSNNTYEIDEYGETLIILDYEEEPGPGRARPRRGIPSWVAVMVSIIWLLAFIFIIIGMAINSFRNKN